MQRRRFLAASLAVSALGPARGHAAPSADLWARWTAHDPQSTATVDHSAWDQILGASVRLGADGVARVDYAALVAERAALDRYLADLQAVSVDALARPEQMAYWINLYNALTVRVIVDHYPVASIRDIDISPGLFARGPWGGRLVRVEGEEISLDDIEHRILRPIWKDPRIHYAVNCASIGCPNLAGQAFTAARLEAMLTEGARAYVNDPRGVSIRSGRVTVSRIYDWFEEDFGASEAGVLAHLSQYAMPGLADALSAVRDIDGYTYDWSINASGRAT